MKFRSHHFSNSYAKSTYKFPLLTLTVSTPRGSVSLVRYSVAITTTQGSSTYTQSRILSQAVGVCLVIDASENNAEITEIPAVTSINRHSKQASTHRASKNVCVQGSRNHVHHSQPVPRLRFTAYPIEMCSRDRLLGTAFISDLSTKESPNKLRRISLAYSQVDSVHSVKSKIGPRHPSILPIVPRWQIMKPFSVNSASPCPKR